MRRPSPTLPVILVSIIILLMLIVSIVTAIHRQPRQETNDASHTSATFRNNEATTKKSDSGTAKNTGVNGSLSPADQAVEANSAHAATDACKLLTIDVAKQILGSSAESSSASDTSQLRTTSTAVTACAFSSSTGGVQLIIRSPINHLGVSENATKFGSGKPSGTVAVNGFGQTAYWDPTEHTLNILGGNNWYIISRTTDTQAGAVEVAKLLQTGF